MTRGLSPAPRTFSTSSPRTCRGETCWPRFIERTAEELNLPCTDEIAASLRASIPSWPAFSDSIEALKRLGAHRRLVGLTNGGRWAAQQMAATLGEPFDDIVTVEDVGVNKPDPQVFAYCLGRQSVHGYQLADYLHVAQSQYHDIGVATKLGYKTAWIERRAGKPSFGGTPVPPSANQLTTISQHSPSLPTCWMTRSRPTRLEVLSGRGIWGFGSLSPCFPDPGGLPGLAWPGWPGDRAGGSFALGDDLLEALRVGLDVGTDCPHRMVGVPGADGGQDGLVLGEDLVRVLEFAVLDGEHHQVEPQFLGQLGVELVEPRAVQQRHDRGVKRQVLFGDPPWVVRFGRLDELVEGLR